MTKATRPKRPSKVPVCAACGKRLRLYKVGKDRTNVTLAARSMRLSNPSITWADFHKKYPYGAAEYNALVLTADSMPPTRGSDGNNLVCHTMCGHLLLVRLLLTLGTDVLAHLPEQWRFRSS